MFRVVIPKGDKLIKPQQKPGVTFNGLNSCQLKKNSFIAVFEVLVVVQACLDLGVTLLTKFRRFE